MKQSIREQVRTGFRMGFGGVAGILTMGLLVYGFMKLRHPDRDDSLLFFLKSYPPRVVGAICLAGAVAILWTTLDRWAKFVSGLFVAAVFGGLIAIAGGGFRSSIPALSLTRAEAGVVTGLYSVCAFLTYRLGSGEPNLVDRLAVLSAPLLIAWTGTSNDRATGFESLVAMVLLIAGASIYHLWEERHRSGRHDESEV